MSITPENPQLHDNFVPEPPPSTPLWIPILIVVLFLGLGAVLYAGYTSRTRLESDLATGNAHADLLSKELEQTRDAQLGQQIGQVKQESEEKIGQVSTDLTGAKTDIASTKKDLDDTKGKLTSTIGDLGVQSGLIARNREEVEALKRLNERNIFDFNLTKSKNPQRVGPIQIALRSTDPKHFRFTMTVIADDKAIEKKDRNVDEPMQFYVRGNHAPYEIVVFEVSKDRATGYLSTNKDNGPAAAAPGAGPSAAATPATAKP